MWPIAVAGLGLRYRVTPLADRLGHPLKKLCRIALRSVVILGLHIDLWTNLMLLALVRTVWENNLNSIGWGFVSVSFTVLPVL